MAGSPAGGTVEMNGSCGINFIVRLAHWWVHSWTGYQKVRLRWRKHIIWACVFGGFTLSPSLCSCSLCFLAVRWAAISFHHGILPTTAQKHTPKWSMTKTYPHELKLKAPPPLSWCCQLFCQWQKKVTFPWLLINSEAICLTLPKAHTTMPY